MLGFVMLRPAWLPTAAERTVSVEVSTNLYRIDSFHIHQNHLNFTISVTHLPGTPAQR